MSAKLVVGNWKMNGDRKANHSLVSALLADPAVGGAVLCPPFVYLEQIRQMLDGSRLLLGAQSVSRYADGAYTGDVSVAMLADFACRYVIVGHSERRSLFAESDADVAAKVALVAATGMAPIVCVGESLEQRRQGVAEQVVLSQLQAVVDLAGSDVLSGLVVAYEPVWAIGTGVTATEQDVKSMHASIKSRLDVLGLGHVPVLYGGSVKQDNAEALMALPGVDGVLVGGASLVAEQFIAICRAAG